MASWPKKDQVVRALKNPILSGRLKPGERIVELELAKELRVGRTAVREAPFELQRQSYGKRHAKRGTYVTHLTVEEAEQIFAVRRELEGLAAELVEGRLKEADAGVLSRVLDAMQEAVSEPDPEKFSKAHLDFHQAIWWLTGNGFLEEALLTIIGPLFALFVMRGRVVNRDELLCSAARHPIVLGSLVRGGGSRRVMQDSIEFLRRQRMDMTFGVDSRETDLACASVPSAAGLFPPAPGGVGPDQPAPSSLESMQKGELDACDL